MCLNVNPEETERVRLLGTFKAWKGIELVVFFFRAGKWKGLNGFDSTVSGELRSPLQYHRYRPGWNVAEIDPSMELNTSIVTSGAIHVFLDKADAERFALVYGCGCGLVVSVTCYADDLIAAGLGWDGKSRTAAYRRVWLDEKDYYDALNVRRSHDY